MGGTASSMPTTGSFSLVEPVTIRACVLCCTNRKDLIDETIQSRQSPNRVGLSSQSHPFLDAVAYGDIEDVKTQLLLDSNLAKSVHDKKGNCAAHIAAFYGHLQVLQFLVETDPDILSATNEVRNTPAHKAAESGKLTILAYLRDRDKALLSTKGAMGASPLHVAAAKVHWHDISTNLQTFTFSRFQTRLAPHHHFLNFSLPISSFSTSPHLHPHQRLCCRPASAPPSPLS